MADFPEFDKQTDEAGDVAMASSVNPIMQRLQQMINEAAMSKFTHKGTRYFLCSTDMPPAVQEHYIKTCMAELNELRPSKAPK